MEQKNYFIAFKEKANDWFKDASFIEKYHNFFKEFFKLDNLQRIEWKDIQQIGDHLHSANSLAMAKKNAFGDRPNHDIEYYRNSFIELAHGNGTPIERLRKFSLDPDYKIKYFGDAIISELAAQVFPEEFVIYNSRSKTALSVLGIDIEKERGDKFVDEFIKFNEAIKPLTKEYENLVGTQTSLPLNFEIDQFLSFIYTTYSNSVEEEDEATASGYWVFAPGEYAKFMNDARKGLIHIGWDSLGDLSKYSSTKEIKDKLGNNEKGRPQKQNAVTCFDFANTLKVDDVIYLRNGRSNIIGKVIVESDYYFDSNAEQEKKHCRKVKFISDLDIKTKKKTAIRALAPLEEGSELFLEIIGDKADFSIDEEKSYFWLNANPRYWNIKEMKVGDSQWYTALNEKGKKRRLYDCFEKAQRGDLVIGYSTTPDKKAVCILEIEDPLKEKDGKSVLYFKKIRDLDREIDLLEIQNHPALKDAIPVNNNQGSLFPLKKNEFEAIFDLSESDEEELNSLEDYGKENLYKEIFLENTFLDRLLGVLDRKKNIVLQGPPGVGKSFLAKRLAYAYLGFKDPEKVKFIQFHQSYSYEDFIQGLRPEEGKAQTFRLKNGLFYDLSLEAIKNPNEKYVLIIDEINRGNLSKIFGELLYLIENDKRGEEHRINLTYSKSQDDTFYVPKNLYIIGTMNTADRSLALVDYALRRRFSFFDIMPSFASNKFQDWMLGKGIEKDLLGHISLVMKNLNEGIARNTHELGPGFQIGHSYFQQISESGFSESWFREVLEFDVLPLLMEYYFNEPEKAKEEMEKLKR